MAGYPWFVGLWEISGFPLTTGEGQGRLYLGSAAMENEHYSQQYALAAHLGATIFSAGWAGSQDFWEQHFFLGNRRNVVIGDSCL